MMPLISTLRKCRLDMICCLFFFSFFLDSEKGNAKVCPSSSGRKSLETGEQDSSRGGSEVDNTHMLSHAFFYPVLQICHPLDRN